MGFVDAHKLTSATPISTSFTALPPSCNTVCDDQDEGLRSEHVASMEDKLELSQEASDTTQSCEDLEMAELQGPEAANSEKNLQVCEESEEVAARSGTRARQEEFGLCNGGANEAHMSIRQEGGERREGFTPADEEVGDKVDDMIQPSSPSAPDADGNGGSQQALQEAVHEVVQEEEEAQSAPRADSVHVDQTEDCKMDSCSQEKSQRIKGLEVADDVVDQNQDPQDQQEAWKNFSQNVSDTVSDSGSAQAQPCADSPARVEAPRCVTQEHLKHDFPPATGQKIDMSCFGGEGSETVTGVSRVHPVLVQGSTGLGKNDECLCLDPRDGQQWLATIIELNKNNAKVHYKGWSKSCDDWVTVDKISPKPTNDVLERIKLYNDHSKQISGNSKLQPNQGKPADSRPCDGKASVGEDKEENVQVPSQALFRSRVRGVELCSKPTKSFPRGQWRVVRMRNKQREVVGTYNSKEEAAQAKALQREEDGEVSRNIGAAGTTFLNVDQDTLDEAVSFLGAKILLDCKKNKPKTSGQVTAWLSSKNVYQIRLDNKSRTVVNLPIPSKRLTVVSKSEGTSHVITEEDVLRPLGQLEEVQSLCDTFPYRNFVGSFGLELARMRALCRFCLAEGILVSPCIAHAPIEDVVNCLHRCLESAGCVSYKKLVSKGAGKQAGQADDFPSSEDDGVPVSLKLDMCKGVREIEGGENEVNKWEAFLEIDGREYVLGQFAVLKEAARAWDMAAIRLLPRGTEHNLPDSHEFKPEKELFKTLKEIREEAKKHRKQEVSKSPKEAVTSGKKRRGGEEEERRNEKRQCTLRSAGPKYDRETMEGAIEQMEGMKKSLNFEEEEEKEAEEEAEEAEEEEEAEVAAKEEAVGEEATRRLGNKKVKRED
eukprot:186792-Hanusia_phi.AAC.1